MARVKIEFPEAAQFFECAVPVRITDLNYGQHVGNDRFLAYLHEVRMAWLSSLGMTELDFFGASLIMADASLAFKAEVFYGDALRASLYATDVSSLGFRLLYRLEVARAEGWKDALHASTGMLCFDYQARKVTHLPAAARALFTSGNCGC